MKVWMITGGRKRPWGEHLDNNCGRICCDYDTCGSAISEAFGKVFY